MSTTAKVLAFGVASGLLWSLLIILIFAHSIWASDIVKILVPGVLSGIIVSLALQKPLARFGRFGTVLLGLLSLPFGAFLFGFFAESVEALTRVNGPGFNPFSSGLFYAGASIVSFYFFAPAVLTTFLLRTVVLSGRSHQ
jgi:hypothetical protein